MKQIKNHYLLALKTSILASEEIMRFYTTSFQKHSKTDGSPVTDADIASSKIIVEQLEKTNIPVISEESKNSDFEIRKNWKEVWIVDPLDGTKEFIKKNDEFAVNIALVKNGRPIFGLIASPVNKKILFGGKEFGVYITDFNHVEANEKWEELTISSINSPIVMARSHAPYELEETLLIEQIQQKDAIDYLKKGSALKFFDLARGLADVYPRFAPTMEWDIAAGQAILEALEGCVLNSETGEALCYNKESLYNPHFIAKTKGFIDFFDKDA